MMPRIKNQSGFTLVEVLVAFTVLAILLGVLYQAFSSGLTTADRTRRYGEAVLIAQSLMAAAGVTDPLTEGDTSGEVDQTYRWRMIVAPYQEGAPGENDAMVAAFEITVTVLWVDNGRETSFSLTTLQLIPVQQ